MPTYHVDWEIWNDQDELTDKSDWMNVTSEKNIHEVVQVARSILRQLYPEYKRCLLKVRLEEEYRGDL